MNKSKAIQRKKVKEIERSSKRVAENLVSPTNPLGLGPNIKVIAEEQSKITGKASFIAMHGVDISIFLGFIWSTLKILIFLYPEKTWTNWVKVIEVFFPGVILCTAVAYRIYPYVIKKIMSLD